MRAEPWLMVPTEGASERAAGEWRSVPVPSAPRALRVQA